MRIKLSVGFPLFSLPAYARLLYKRWNKPYGRNTQLVIQTTRFANFSLFSYMLLAIAILSQWFIFPEHECQRLNALMFYLQSVVVLWLILPRTLTTRHKQVVVYDPVFLLSLLNCFIASLQGTSVDNNCLVCRARGECFAGWNFENWNRFNFADILTAW